MMLKKFRIDHFLILFSLIFVPRFKRKATWRMQEASTTEVLPWNS